MKKEEFQNILERISTKLYGYAFSLLADELASEKAVLDAITVYLMKNKNRLLESTSTSLLKAQELKFKKEIEFDLLKEVFNLANVRAKAMAYPSDRKTLYKEFFRLDLFERSIIYLKTIEGLSFDEIALIQSMKKHQVVEKSYHARLILLNDFKGQDLNG